MSDTANRSPFRDCKDFMLNQYVQTIEVCNTEEPQNSCLHSDSISGSFTEIQKRNILEFQAMTKLTACVVKKLLNEKNYESSSIIDVKKDYGAWNIPNSNVDARLYSIRIALKQIIQNSELHDKEKDAILVLGKEAADEVLNVKKSCDCGIMSATEMSKLLTERLGYKIIVEDFAISAQKGGEYVWSKQKAVICIRSDVPSCPTSTCLIFMKKKEHSSPEKDSESDKKETILPDEYTIRFHPKLGILLVNLF